MAGLSSDVRQHYGRMLEKTRELAEQVRETAERVHQQALEAHRLIEIARRQSARGRELSRKGREEARAVEATIQWSLDTANKAERHPSGKRAGLCR
jgi:methyl-accepting chemotaxis protein